VRGLESGMPHRNSDVNAVNSVNPVRGQHSQPCQYCQCRQKTAAARRHCTARRASTADGGGVGVGPH
ncbi:MAG: hypothetical protein ACK48K_08205, partial [Planctomycetota bacterium]